MDPQTTTRRGISLNDSSWFVGGVAAQPFGAVEDFAHVEGWLPASVPGDVRLDLLRAGKIPDPFLGYNNEASQWVDDLDWWYRKDVELEAGADRRAFLVFEGIDYQSAVLWDGTELGRHVGMFARQVYEIPPGLVGGGTHRLAVRVWGSSQLPRPRLHARQRAWKKVVNTIIPHAEPAPEFPDRYATLKTAMSFGWDFAPRLRTCGIWDNAWLLVVRDVFIRDVRVLGVPDGRVRIILELDAPHPATLDVHVTVRGKSFEGEPQSFQSPLHHDGSGQYALGLSLRDPRVWNPWDRGEPNTYSLRLSVTDDRGELDTVETTFGLRTIDLLPNPGAGAGDGPWTFVLNDVPEFIRGANWVPADAIPARITRDDYAALLHLARRANINLLRVWGGGLREKRAFYDLCDELGILVWQEFPFSGAGIDHFPRDAGHRALADRECRAIVRALRNHPSLALWCGGNEFSPALNRALVETMRVAVALEDGTRPFKPASPSRGESHNWRVWHGKANTRDYRKDHALFFGEFGLQAPPAVETLGRFLSDDELYAPGRMWEYHNAQLDKLYRYAKPLLADETASQETVPRPGEASVSIPDAADHAPRPAALDALVNASQLAQRRGLQIAIEHARRNKPRVSGCAFWQFNEPWYSICWSVVDYTRRAKPAYEKIRELYNPLHISFEYPLIERAAGAIVQGTVWLVNDTLQELSGSLRAWHNGELILDAPATAEPDSSRRVVPLAVTLLPGANELRFELVGGDVLSTNEYDLNYCDRGETTRVAALLATGAARLHELT